MFFSIKIEDWEFIKCNTPIAQSEPVSNQPSSFHGARRSTFARCLQNCSRRWNWMELGTWANKTWESCKSSWIDGPTKIVTHFSIQIPSVCWFSRDFFSAQRDLKRSQALKWCYGASSAVAGGRKYCVKHRVRCAASDFGPTWPLRLLPCWAELGQSDVTRQRSAGCCGRQLNTQDLAWLQRLKLGVQCWSKWMRHGRWKRSTSVSPSVCFFPRCFGSYEMIWSLLNFHSASHNLFLLQTEW